jgi:hypothetical protein
MKIPSIVNHHEHGNDGGCLRGFQIPASLESRRKVPKVSAKIRLSEV